MIIGESIPSAPDWPPDGVTAGFLALSLAQAQKVCLGWFCGVTTQCLWLLLLLGMWVGVWIIPGSAQGLLVALCSRIFLGGMWGDHKCAREQTKIGCVVWQVPYPV